MYDEKKYYSFEQVATKKEAVKLGIWVIGIFVLLLLFIVFAPWTQNVQGDGKVTTLKPDQQPHLSLIHI